MVFADKTEAETSLSTMDSLAIRFVDYLLECRYIGPSASNPAGLTERNLMDIYNTTVSNLTMSNVALLGEHILAISAIFTWSNNSS